MHFIFFYCKFTGTDTEHAVLHFLQVLGGLFFDDTRNSCGAGKLACKSPVSLSTLPCFIGNSSTHACCSLSDASSILMWPPARLPVLKQAVPQMRVFNLNNRASPSLLPAQTCQV